MIAPRDMAALMNTVAIPVEVIAILTALAITGRTLGEQGAEVIVAIMGGQVAATVTYLSRGAE